MRKTLQFLAMARLVGLNPQCAFSQRERLASDTACGSAIRRSALLPRRRPMVASIGLQCRGNLQNPSILRVGA